MNLHATQGESVSEPRAGLMKFTYTSGSRPLEGYTIKRGVGRGGFGEVYYATSDAGKEVALKLIRRNLDVEIRGVSQCLNMKHPNLLGLFDIKQDALEDSWVVMEYMNGECLESVIQRHPNGLPLNAALNWYRGICSGVAYLHDHGVVHRDLKPGNIFCDEGVVKIGDYGLSKFISASRRSGQTESVGTVHYMAPEIGRGRYGKEIDIYALGIILYEVLTGRVPFDGESVGEVLMKHLTAEPDLSLLQEPYRTVVARALDKDPERRLKTVQELMAMIPGFASANGSATTGAAAYLATGVVGDALPQATAGQGRAPRAAAAQRVPPPPPPGYSENWTQEGEPIARYVRSGFRQIGAFWRNPNVPTAVKVVVLIVSIFALGSTLPIWVMTGMGLLCLYCLYYAVRSIVLAGHRAHPTREAAYRTARYQSPQRSTQPHVTPRAPRGPPNPRTPASPFAEAAYRRPRQERPLAALPVKTVREKTTDLLGSLLIVPCVVCVFGVVMTILGGASLGIQEYTWLSLVSTVGAWLVMIPAKVWEGRNGDHMVRRFVMLVLGIGLGIVAYGSQSWLLVSLPHEWANRFPPANRFAPDLYDSVGHPNIMAYGAYFGLLMVFLRWWRQADPLRGSRLSIWSTGVTAGVAYLLTIFWNFPQPWGLMVALTTSIAVQVASPWHDVHERTRELTA